MRKKVSKIELQHELKDTLEKNVNAIDYIEECLNKCNDRLGYNENDTEAVFAKKNLEYIKFTLYYLDKQYMKAFKNVGGKL